MKAEQSVLFEAPIAHFLLRTFLAEGVDEFLAHITTIEVFLGLQGDYHKRSRVGIDQHKNLSATKKYVGASQVC